MVGVRPTTLVGHPRTNHQSVMEHGGVRPAHLVGHPSLRSRQGNPGSEYQAQLPWGISQRGNLQLRPNAWWSWSDTHPDRRALFSVIILAAGRTRTSKGMRFWSDQFPHSATINLGLCDDVRSTPPFLPPAISDRKIRFPGNREPWFWRC